MNFCDEMLGLCIVVQVFFCALIDVAGHAGNIDTAFAILQEMKSTGINPGPSTYNTLMVVCGNVSMFHISLHVLSRFEPTFLESAFHR